MPQEHRTDNLSAAIIRVGKRDELTSAYRGLLDHYQLKASHTNPYSSNENGDVEQSHHRFKKAVRQALSLRGSCEFATREDYSGFLREVIAKRNGWRKVKLKEELVLLSPLPSIWLEDFTQVRVWVTRNNAILIKKNIYFAASQLIGEKVDIRLHAESLEVWFGNQKIESLPRLRGDNKHAINYRHVIHSLLRKPGALPALSLSTKFVSIAFVSRCI